MFKKLILIFILLMVPAFVYAENFNQNGDVTYHTFRLRVFQGEKGLFIDNKFVDGDWQFRYFITKEDKVTSGMIEDGPIVSYVSNVITGEITLPSLHPVLTAKMKDNSEFRIDYINNKQNERDDQIFDKCRIDDMQMIKNKAGTSKVIYSFRVGAVL